MARKIHSAEIEELNTLLRGYHNILPPGSPEFDRSMTRWSDIGCQSAGVAILPEDVHDVEQVVNFARDSGIDLAIRCGGHSTDTSASTDGGILMDLRRMNQVKVDTSSQTITVQGGALWADVHRAIADSNLAVVSGTASHVGVGGLTVRGGYGYLGLRKEYEYS